MARDSGVDVGSRGEGVGGVGSHGGKKAVTAVCKSSDVMGELQRDQSCSPVLSHTHL